MAPAHFLILVALSWTGYRLGKIDGATPAFLPQLQLKMAWQRLC
jgi:hypothetical protein